MNVGSLFSGCGGLDLAVHAVFGAEPTWFCESDPHCRKVLSRHWPGVPIYKDVHDIGTDTPRVDLLHGGYPCQPFSYAGLKGGAEDPRHLWPEFRRVIRLLRPRIIVAENVAGHLILGFDRVLSDLAEMGMDVRWGVVRASDVGAPHKRARLFIIATDSIGPRARRHGGSTSGAEEQERRQTSEKPDPFGLHVQSPPDTARNGRSRRREAWGRGTGPEEHRDATSRGETSSDSDINGLQMQWRQQSLGCNTDRRDRENINWGPYQSAISRWEELTATQAPQPTDDQGRLRPELVEWMMGFPVGWTGGLAKTNRLRILGNAVCPQQGALALSLLQ